MRIFLSAGEPSGDIHGANLIRELKSRQPDLDVVGFGGEKMAAAGSELLYPLANHAVVGLARVLAQIGTFIGLINQADRYFRDHRPDAVVLIDYPGMHWHLARRAKAHGIPVYYFVPPQIWAWAQWRVEKMRKYVDHVLCTLPFERTWYAERGIDAPYIGHPFFDELPRQQLDQGFLSEQRAKGGEIVALLPGSRTQEVEYNTATLLEAAAKLHRERPETRFLVASFKAKQRDFVDAAIQKYPELPVETHLGKTPEILDLCKVCLSVSGSVALEIMYRKKPTVILYRVNGFSLWVAGFFKKAKHICLVNLLADKEIYPEFLTGGDESTAIAAQLHKWLENPADYAATVGELSALLDRVAQPGACARAADVILATFAGAKARAA